METWKNDKNKRAIAILRVSSSAQRDNNSHDVQEQEVVEYCQKNGLHLVKPFRIAESAKSSGERKKYREAIDYVLANGVRHVLFYMQDREARNLTNLEENEKLVLDDRIVLHYVHDKRVLTKDSPDSEFLSRDFQGVIHKQYCRGLGLKVSSGQVYKAQQGWFPGGRLPMGYIHLRPKDDNGKEIKRAPTTVIVDPVEKNVKQVRREFELRANGHSLDQIRETILTEGFIRIGQERHYHRSEIERRLKNKFYWGFFDWDGVEYKGHHPLIVPKPISDAVRISFGFNTRGGVNTNEDAVFSGFMRCANSDCGCQVTYEKKRKMIKSTGEAKVYNLYRCANSKGVHKSLKGMYAHEESVWQQFEKGIDAFDLTPEMAKDIADALDETHRKGQAATRREAEAHRETIAQIDRKNDQLFDLFLAKTIAEEEYRRQVERIKAERQKVMHLLEEANIAINDACMKTAKEIFELATNATSLWKKSSRFERLAYLKKVCSNQVLDGSTLRFDLYKPFAVISEIKEFGIESD